MIEIVSHCFGARYAALLVYQLSSLALHEIRAITVTVLYVGGDKAASAVVNYLVTLAAPGYGGTLCRWRHR